MEEPQQNLHDGLDYPGSSLLHGSFVGKVLPEEEPDNEAKKDEVALPTMGYGPKKQPRPSVGKSQDLLELNEFWDDSEVGDEHMYDVPSSSNTQRRRSKEVKVQGPERKWLTHGAAPVLFTSQEFVTKKQVIRLVKEYVNRKIHQGKVPGRQVEEPARLSLTIIKEAIERSKVADDSVTLLKRRLEESQQGVATLKASIEEVQSQNRMSVGRGRPSVGDSEAQRIQKRLEETNGMVEEVRHELQELTESAPQTRTMVKDLQQALDNVGTENKQGQRRVEKLEKSVKMLDQVQKDQHKRVGQADEWLRDETRQSQQECDRQGDREDKISRWIESLETKVDLLKPRSVQPASQGHGTELHTTGGPGVKRSHQWS